MKNIFWIVIAGCFLYVPSLANNSNVMQAGQKAVKGPNVIIVLSDDQGYGDFSCNGNPVLKTPALDRLNSEGIRFSNFHVTPLCTPSRGELMSGMAAMHNKASTVLTGRGLMRRDITIMPEVFKANGYQTGIFGKWHLGDSYPDRPMDRGFQKCIWIKGWGILSETEFDNDYYKTRYMDSLETKQSDKYCSDLWFDEAMKWMDEKADNKEPFFTYLALNAPHGPFHSPKKDYDLYRSKVDDNATASFLGMVSNIDNNMDRLDKWLDKKGIKNNTIVIFMNDNGGTGGVKLYNAGMKGEKGSLYDGGHRAVCMLRWPGGKLGAPRTIEYASTIRDLLPTFIDLLNLKSPGKPQFDGKSLKPVLASPNKPLDNRMFVVQYGGYARTSKYESCVVWDAWRLIGGKELYDIKKDAGQQQDVSGKYPEVIKKMRTFYESWWATVEQGIDKFVPLLIGASQEDPVILSSGFWEGGDVNTQWAVAQGAGGSKGGVWHIQVEKEGRYQLELSRWPFHLNRKLTIAGPQMAVGATKLREGKALPVEFGCVSLNNNEPLVVKAKPEATNISMEMEMKKGENILQAFFRNREGEDLCGAYYVRVRRIP